jgi:hypothetical protein
MLTATRQASKANAPFFLWAIPFCAAYALALWAGPKIENAIAPAMVDVHVAADDSYPGAYIVSGDLRRGCQVAGVGSHSPWLFFGRSTSEYHLVSETARAEIVVTTPPEGAEVTLRCPLMPWLSRGPIPAP